MFSSKPAVTSPVKTLLCPAIQSDFKARVRHINRAARNIIQKNLVYFQLIE